MVPPLNQSSKVSEDCNSLMFEAVNENSVSKLQLALVTYSPIQLLTSLAHCNGEGETPLVVAMKRENVSVIKEMVSWMSYYPNLLCKECKPISMFIINQLIHHIPVLQLIGHLVGKGSLIDKNWLELIGLVFSQSTSLARQDKIIALELIGALAIIYCCNSMSRLALKYWSEAMTLRYFPQDDEPLLPKLPVVCVLTQASTVLFGSDAEIMTMEDLKLMERDRTLEKVSNMLLNRGLPFRFRKQMQIQALLVIRRIYTQANLGHPHWLYLVSFLEFAFCSEMPENIAINTYNFILEQLNGFDPKLLSFYSFDVFTTTMSVISTFFFEMLEEGLVPPPAREELTFENFLPPTKFIATISQFFPNPAMISSVKFQEFNFVEIVYRFLWILKSLSPQITDQEKHQLEEYYSNYIRNFFPERASTVLHLAAEEVERRFNLFKVHTQIKLILQLGADPNAIDEMGRTPLHILAGMKKKHHLKDYLALFQTLVNAGTYLDLAADNGETVISILKKKLIRKNRDSMKPSHRYFDSLINDVFPLTCYCARVIQRHRIPFKDHLPPRLVALVSP